MKYKKINHVNLNNIDQTLVKMHLFKNWLNIECLNFKNDFNGVSNVPTFNELYAQHFTDYELSVPFSMIRLWQGRFSRGASCSEKNDDDHYYLAQKWHKTTMDKMTRKLGPSFDELLPLRQDELYLLGKGVNFHCVGEICSIAVVFWIVQFVAHWPKIINKTFTLGVNLFTT